MEDEELRNTIDEIDQTMKCIEGLNIFGNGVSAVGRQFCQKRVNQAYDKLFKLKKHLLYLEQKGKKYE